MLRGFSRKQGICCFSTVVPRHHTSALKVRICPENSAYTCLNRDNRRPANIAFSVPFAVTPSTGILTCFPSTTPFGLALGSTHPAPINVGQEPLVFRRAGFSPALSLLMSAFALLIPPACLTGTPSQAYRTLPYPTTHSVAAAASVHGLARYIFRAGRLDQ